MLSTYRIIIHVFNILGQKMMKTVHQKPKIPGRQMYPQEILPKPARHLHHVSFHKKCSQIITTYARYLLLWFQLSRLYKKWDLQQNVHCCITGLWKYHARPGPISSGQVENFNLPVLGQVQNLYKVNKILYFIF